MEPVEAKESLELIKDASRASRQAIARAGTGYLFIVWGVVWLVGYLGSQLLPGPASGYLWLVLDTIGIVGSVIAILRHGRRVRSEQTWRLGAFWILLLLHGSLMMWVVWPLSSERYILFVTLLVSMGYSLIGLWISMPLAVIGMAISILAIIGWLLIPALLGYWLAIVGGGGLIAAGIYVLKAWK
jgi:hypothetical protein